ncbi:hypothetical protein [Pseudomonas sp. N040]|uniref:hypothetical protein n=1 Tax=Pseudomonas sp. N040 TaxID=2785325 RepID=UPI0018A273A7|nr:hypothetical protein [Pseudomonas sp. N040]MBF7728991.1 hypothetical protein [Pseudomonas sp. N040]MBW7012631.1 hypothetical protein [Pseudomonas sp. N040]
MKALNACLATLLFLILLVVIYWLHMRYLRVDVVFYAALVDVLSAGILAAVVLLTFRRFALFSGFEKAQLVLVWLLAGYALAISLPTVIDRSLSFYILEKLQQRGGGIRQDRFEEVFTREYVREHHLVEVRLTEQRASGTIRIDNGCVTLTTQGDRLAHWSRWFRLHLLPRNRLLLERYGDDLVDPFLQDGAVPSYECARENP